MTKEYHVVLEAVRCHLLGCGINCQRLWSARGNSAYLEATTPGFFENRQIPWRPCLIMYISPNLVAGIDCDVPPRTGFNLADPKCFDKVAHFVREHYDYTSIKQQFRQLHVQWLNERPNYSSNVEEVCGTDAYNAIIALGKDVIPHILEASKRDPDHWTIALTKITGVNPIKYEHRGYLMKMIQDWSDWGQENGYC